jgi:hypothetical protein
MISFLTRYFELATQAKEGNIMLELYQIMAIIQEQFRIILRFAE